MIKNEQIGIGRHAAIMTEPDRKIGAFVIYHRHNRDFSRARLRSAVENLDGMIGSRAGVLHHLQVLSAMAPIWPFRIFLRSWFLISPTGGAKRHFSWSCESIPGIAAAHPKAPPCG